MVNKYTMRLSHVPNVDIGCRGGYWQPRQDEKDIHLKENKLSIIRDKFINWKERNGLGAGNMGLMWVKDRVGKKIGYFSYNGRFWRTSQRKEVV